MNNTKEKMRKTFLMKRYLLSKDEVVEKSKIITEKIYSLNDYRDAKSVFTYISFDNEVSTEELIDNSLKTKKVFVPIVDEECVSELKSLKDTKENIFGIREPLKPKKTKPEEIEIFFVPGIVFDKRGNRIGFGSGYFDRLLKKVKNKRPIYALAFDFQVINTIEPEAGDVPMDYIITEKKIYGVEK